MSTTTWVWIQVELHWCENEYSNMSMSTSRESSLRNVWPKVCICYATRPARPPQKKQKNMAETIMVKKTDSHLPVKWNHQRNVPGYNSLNVSMRWQFWVVGSLAFVSFTFVVVNLQTVYKAPFYYTLKTPTISVSRPVLTHHATFWGDSPHSVSEFNYEEPNSLRLLCKEITPFAARKGCFMAYNRLMWQLPRCDLLRKLPTFFVEKFEAARWQFKGWWAKFM